MLNLFLPGRVRTVGKGVTFSDHTSGPGVGVPEPEGTRGLGSLPVPGKEVSPVVEPRR